MPKTKQDLQVEARLTALETWAAKLEAKKTTSAPKAAAKPKAKKTKEVG